MRSILERSRLRSPIPCCILRQASDWKVLLLSSFVLTIFRPYLTTLSIATTTVNGLVVQVVPSSASPASSSSRPVLHPSTSGPRIVSRTTLKKMTQSSQHAFGKRKRGNGNYGSIFSSRTQTTASTSSSSLSAAAGADDGDHLEHATTIKPKINTDVTLDDDDDDDYDDDDEGSSLLVESQDISSTLMLQEKEPSSSTTTTTTGRKILELAVPALGALLIDPLLTIADTAFVGRYESSPAELAGMGSATALLTFSFYIFNFLCTATTPLVAQKRSSGQEHQAVQVGGQALSLALGLGSVLSLTLIALGQPLLHVMGTSITGPEANTYAMQFLVVRSIAAPAVFTISASTGILRGYLDTKTPIVVLLAANIINFSLDVVFIVLLKMGPMGAALATTTAEWISAVLFLLVLAGKLPSADGELGKKETMALTSTQPAENMKTGNSLNEPTTTTTKTRTLVVTPSLSIPSWDEIRPLVVASSAVFLRSTVLQLFLSAAAAFAARSTTGAESSISAHQIAIQLWMLCSYTADALAAASQALVADAIGRQRSDDVVDVSRTVFVYSSVLGVLLGTLLYVGFASHFLFDLFTNDEGTQLALLGVSSLLVLSQPLNSLVFAADGVLQGASEFPYQAKTMAVSAIVGICGFLVLQYVDPNGGELIHVWGAIIVLQAMRGLTSALKICDSAGPIRLLSPSGKDA